MPRREVREDSHRPCLSLRLVLSLPIAVALVVITAITLGLHLHGFNVQIRDVSLRTLQTTSDRTQERLHHELSRVERLTLATAAQIRLTGRFSVEEEPDSPNTCGAECGRLEGLQGSLDTTPGLRSLGVYFGDAGVRASVHELSAPGVGTQWVIRTPTTTRFFFANPTSTRYGTVYTAIPNATPGFGSAAINVPVNYTPDTRGFYADPFLRASTGNHMLHVLVPIRSPVDPLVVVGQAIATFETDVVQNLQQSTASGTKTVLLTRDWFLVAASDGRSTLGNLTEGIAAGGTAFYQQCQPVWVWDNTTVDSTRTCRFHAMHWGAHEIAEAFEDTEARAALARGSGTSGAVVFSTSHHLTIGTRVPTSFDGGGLILLTTLTVADAVEEARREAMLLSCLVSGAITVVAIVAAIGCVHVLVRPITDAGDKIRRAARLEMPHFSAQVSRSTRAPDGGAQPPGGHELAMSDTRTTSGNDDKTTANARVGGGKDENDSRRRGGSRGGGGTQPRSEGNGTPPRASSANAMRRCAAERNPSGSGRYAPDSAVEDVAGGEEAGGGGGGARAAAAAETRYSWIAETNDLHIAYHRLSYAIAHSAKYVPAEALFELSHYGRLLNNNLRRCTGTVLSCTLWGLSGGVSRADPRCVVECMRAFASIASSVARDHDGLLDRLAGDTVVVAWGMNGMNSNHAVKATLATLRLVHDTRVQPIDSQRQTNTVPPSSHDAHNSSMAMALLTGAAAGGGRAGGGRGTEEERRAHRSHRRALRLALHDVAGEAPVALRCGLCSGDLHNGNIGTSDRATSSVIGAPVSLASRLSRLAMVLEQRALVSKTTMDLLPPCIVAPLAAAVQLDDFDVAAAPEEEGFRFGTFATTTAATTPNPWPSLYSPRMGSSASPPPGGSLSPHAELGVRGAADSTGDDSVEGALVACGLLPVNTLVGITPPQPEDLERLDAVAHIRSLPTVGNGGGGPSPTPGGASIVALGPGSSNDSTSNRETARSFPLTGTGTENSTTDTSLSIQTPVGSRDSRFLHAQRCSMTSARHLLLEAATYEHGALLLPLDRVSTVTAIADAIRLVLDQNRAPSPGAASALLPAVPTPSATTAANDDDATAERTAEVLLHEALRRAHVACRENISVQRSVSRVAESHRRSVVDRRLPEAGEGENDEFFEEPDLVVDYDALEYGEDDDDDDEDARDGSGEELQEGRAAIGSLLATRAHMPALPLLPKPTDEPNGYTLTG